MEQSKNIIQLINELNELKSELPIDWVGTGDWQSGEKQEKEWNEKWDKIIKEIIRKVK